MSKPTSKKESYGKMDRDDARRYCKHASSMYAKFGKKIMKRAKRRENKDGEIC